IFSDHSKPNRGPHGSDISLPYIFLLGDKLRLNGRPERRGFMPYNCASTRLFLVLLGHGYFGLLVAAYACCPVYFHYENCTSVLKRRDWRDLIWSLSFLCQVSGTCLITSFSSTLESHWFVSLHCPDEPPADGSLTTISAGDLVHPAFARQL
uniref:Protein S-acyltransferase n=1 Tax=Macrostomum lignano TaxID=282301 RepID=A0A1I8JN72_9PLAT